MAEPRALRRIGRGDVAAHRVTVPGVQDEIYAPLYDSIVYPTAGAPYNFVPVWIESNQAFSVQVNFPALVPITASTTAAPTRFICRLRGRLIRDAQ